MVDLRHFQNDFIFLVDLGLFQYYIFFPFKTLQKLGHFGVNLRHFQNNVMFLVDVRPF